MTQTLEVFRPSQSGYWSKCAAFMRLTRDKPEDTCDAAREGTCAAWVGDVTLNGDFARCEDMIGMKHDNGWMVTVVMASDVQDYVDLVQSYGGEVTAEEHVVASENPLIKGSLDSSVVASRILRIIDLKYGRLIVENTSPQIVCYGYGKLLELPEGSIDEIHLSIYQPRGFHSRGIYRTRIVTPQKLHEEFVELWKMAVEGQRPDSIATPGSHCDGCAAAAGCEALSHTVYKMVEVIQSREHRDMSGKELSRELDFVDEVKKTMNAYFKAIENEAVARMRNESIPGWGMESTYGNRVFNTSGVNVQLLTGVDPWLNKICTPAELERRGSDIPDFKEKLKKFTKQPTTGHKLTRVTDEDVASMFNANKGT